MALFQKKSFFFLLLLIGGGVGFYNYQKYNIAPKITEKQINFFDEEAQAHTLQAFNDKNKIVVFGASWCRDCRAEVPILENLKQKLGTSEFHYISLTDDNFTKINTFKESTGSTFDFFSLEKSLKEIGIFSIPTVYVVNQKGEIVLNHVGNYHWDSPAVIEKIKKAVAP